MFQPLQVPRRHLLLYLWVQFHNSWNYSSFLNNLVMKISNLKYAELTDQFEHKILKSKKFNKLYFINY